MNIHDYMYLCQDKTYEWGVFDCCTFAAGAIEAVAGYNVMEGHLRYNDEFSCAIVMQEDFQTSSVRDAFLALAKKYNARRIENNESRVDGDVVSIKWPFAQHGRGKVDQRYGMGVYYRNKVWACVATRGIVNIPVEFRVEDVWRFECHK